MPAKKATPQKCKAAATTLSSPIPKQHRMTRSTVTTVFENGPWTAWSTAAIVSRDDNKPRPLTTADIPAIVNAVLEAC